MKMPEIARCAVGVLAIALFCGLYGCSPSGELPDPNAFANAMEDYQAGRDDPAIAGFKRVLESNPKHELAHYQLAIALQDKKKDYLGAIIHYTLYLEFRPKGDKTTEAEDRIKVCKDLLLAEHARKNGNAPVRKAAASDVDKKVSAENTRLKAEVKKLKDGNQRLSATLRKVEPCLDIADKKRAANLRAEVKKVLAEVGEPETKEKPRSLVNPTNTELLDDESGEGLLASQDAKDKIAQMKAEEDSGPAHPSTIKRPPLIVNSSPSPDPKPEPSVARAGTNKDGLNGLPVGDKKPSGPERPATYKVQSGDTLQGLALRFYGSRSKWRDIKEANMATISADDRLKAGQVIKLP